MKKVRFSFLLIGSFFWILTLNHSALACDGNGLQNGADCHFEECECASEVCFNGKCVECAIDSDCQDGKKCSENNCQ